MPALTLHQIGLANWPIGLQYSFEYERRAMLAPDAGPLLQNNHLAAAAHVDLTPAFLRLGPIIKIEPVAFWDGQLRLYGTRYFGTFTTVTALPDAATPATAEFKQAHRDDRVDALGLRVEANSRLKARAGPMIAVFELEARYVYVDPGDPEVAWIWEPTEMLSLPTYGAWTTLQNLLVVASLLPHGDPDRRLWIGLLAQQQQSPAAQDRHLRAGPIAWIDPWQSPRAPNLVLGVQPWWISRAAPTFPPYTWAALRWEQRAADQQGRQ